MSGGIDTEAVHTHLDKLAVAAHEVVGYVLILRVEVHAVAIYLRPPTGIVVPVERAEVVPIVVFIIVIAFGVLHLRQASGMLQAAFQREVVVRQASAVFLRVGNHALVYLRLVGIPVAGEEFAEVLLAEVTRMVQHDVKDDFHTARVGSVNQVLEEDVLRLCVCLVAAVHFGEVACVVAVVVVAGSVLHDWGNPDSGEAEGFDVVETFDDTFEVATPSRVAHVVLLRVPTLGVVRWVAVVETGGHEEIDTLVTEVRAAAEGG